jgi:hypothetical protein
MMPTTKTDAERYDDIAQQIHDLPNEPQDGTRAVADAALAGKNPAAAARAHRAEQDARAVLERGLLLAEHELAVSIATSAAEKRDIRDRAGNLRVPAVQPAASAAELQEHIDRELDVIEQAQSANRDRIEAEQRRHAAQAHITAVKGQWIRGELDKQPHADAGGANQDYFDPRRWSEHITPQQLADAGYTDQKPTVATGKPLGGARIDGEEVTSV